jgi:hypothetical protein
VSTAHGEMTEAEEREARTADVVAKLRAAQRLAEEAYRLLEDAWPHRMKAESIHRGRVSAAVDLLALVAGNVEHSGGKS